MELIKIRNLNVSFKNKKDIIHIIRGVDIDLNPGQIIGLVGESGSGKSVTAKSILGLNDGSINTVDYINVDGIDLKNKIEKNIAPYEIRGSKVGYIPQDPMTSLNPTRTIYKQILDSINLHRPELVNEADKEEYIATLLERFGIKNARKVYKQYPHTFSGGMRQRIAIAMMVACNPKVIIADEPTTALDTTVQAAVLELFQEIKKEGISIIFISHNIAVVAKLCDYIYVMYAGKVVEKAEKKELFTNPKHPYTWALMASIPEGVTDEKLYTIPGTPPNMKYLSKGDPFAPRNPFSLKIDFEKEPHLFKVNETHYAATWLLHENAPAVEIPEEVKQKIEAFKKGL